MIEKKRKQIFRFAAQTFNGSYKIKTIPVVWIVVINSISDVYLFSSLSFSVCYVRFKSRICNVHFVSVFIFRLEPSLTACVANPNFGRANIIHHFISVFSLHFFYHSSCRRDQLTVLIFKFGLTILLIQVYLRLGWPSLVCHCGFAFGTSVFV